MPRNKKIRAHRGGQRAEWAALALLLCKGYLPLMLRYKTPVGEIDLIARRGNILVFVEVKARAARDDAAHAIHAKNQSRVMRAAQMFLATHPAYARMQVRFDAVLLAWYRFPHHIKNAFHE